MNTYFRRQLIDYVEYHRDPWNCAMHVFGIVFLFLAAILPLSLWSFTLLGVEVSAAVVAVLPVLFYWFLLDLALGAGIFCGAVALLSAAAWIVSHVTTTGMWSITGVLLVVGIASQVASIVQSGVAGGAAAACGAWAWTLNVGRSASRGRLWQRSRRERVLMRTMVTQGWQGGLRPFFLRIPVSRGNSLLRSDIKSP